MSKILIDISAHGYGHMIQTLPVAGKLQKLRPDLTIVLRSKHAPIVLKEEGRMFGHFAYAQGAGEDFFPKMINSYTIDLDATIANCRDLGHGLETVIAREIDVLANEKIDLVVSNVSPVSLVAARRMGLPSVALCSLDWFAVLSDFDGIRAACAREIGWIRDAYASPSVFLRPQPHIGCGGLGNWVEIGHISREGCDVRAELAVSFGIPDGATLVMLSSGGLPDLPFTFRIPPREGVFFILPNNLHEPGDDRIPVSALDRWGFVDVIASVDVLIAKPGFGLITEAITNGTRFASLERNDWVDVNSLEIWGRKHGVFQKISKKEIESEVWFEKVLSLASHATGNQVPSQRAEEAARVVPELIEAS